MTPSLEALERLLLLRLAFVEEGEFLKDIRTSLSAARRRRLVREGYIAEEKRRHPETGRSATYLLLEDRGWGWCQDHLRDEINTRSTQATPILERLLWVLADYFEAQDHTTSLGQLIYRAQQGRATGEAVVGEVATLPFPSPALRAVDGGTAADVTAEAAAGDPLETGDALETVIATACQELAGGRGHVRIRLADLRRRLNEPRPTLDQKLLEMERRGRLVLYRLDDPREILPEDRDAVLHTPAGNERHILYWDP